MSDTAVIIMGVVVSIIGLFVLFCSLLGACRKNEDASASVEEKIIKVTKTERKDDESWTGMF